MTTLSLPFDLYLIKIILFLSYSGVEDETGSTPTKRVPQLPSKGKSGAVPQYILNSVIVIHRYYLNIHTHPSY